MSKNHFNSQDSVVSSLACSMTEQEAYMKGLRHSARSYHNEVSGDINSSMMSGVPSGECTNLVTPARGVGHSFISFFIQAIHDIS